MEWEEGNGDEWIVDVMQVEFVLIISGLLGC